VKYLEGFLQNLSGSIIAVIYNTVVGIVGRDVVRDVKTYNDPDYGFVIRFVVDLDAREALKLWLKLVEIFPYSRYGVVVGIKWVGEDNVSEDELVDYIVKIMVVSGLKLIARKSLNTVRELTEERSRR
jgi:hypothetical protein